MRLRRWTYRGRISIPLLLGVGEFEESEIMFIYQRLISL